MPVTTAKSAKRGAVCAQLFDGFRTLLITSIQAGIHPKVVSERLGHSTIAITLDIYSHVTPSMQQHAADTVASVIFGP